MKIINAKGLVRFASFGGRPEKEGYLMKRGEVNKGFQRRWFILRGNLLFYYEKRGDKEPVGVIVLEGCTIEVADCEDVDNYAFQITFPGSAMRTYVFSADSQENLEEWMKALSCASYDYVKLIVAELENQLHDTLEEENAKIVQAADRDSRILGRAYSEEVAPERLSRRPASKRKDRINPFNDSWAESDAEDFDAFRERASSSSLTLNLTTWQMLGVSSFQQMHDVLRQQMQEMAAAAVKQQESGCSVGGAGCGEGTVANTSSSEAAAAVVAS
jgi:hypothetical protein